VQCRNATYSAVKNVSGLSGNSILPGSTETVMNRTAIPAAYALNGTILTDLKEIY
jgi:hypothetical protein